jgi:hypothetical protein
MHHNLHDNQEVSTTSLLRTLDTNKGKNSIEQEVIARKASFLSRVSSLPPVEKLEGATKTPTGAITISTGEIIDPVFDVRAGDYSIAVTNDRLVVDVVKEWTSLGGQTGQSNLEDHISWSRIEHCLKFYRL